MTPIPQEPSNREDAGGHLTTDGEKIVISGMSGLYPQAQSVSEFSDILYNKINPVRSDNLRWKYNHPEVAQWTGNVPNLERFDAQFFKVHYRLGNNMDPMARKLLEQAFQAIYDAGVSPEHLNGRKVGVYIGTCFSESEKACFYMASTRNGFGIAGSSKTMFANRISYWLNAKGPSLSIDDACCSSIAALEQAYQAIHRGECEAAIVGGANLCLHPQSSIHYGRIMTLCMDGKTKSFDAHANGCAKSEAVNVLFLQKAKDALRIYANIVHVKSEFTSVLEGETGPKYGFYRDPITMVNFLKHFYDEAKVSPEAVEYVEAFGSAVPEADKAELEAIDEVFCKNRKEALMVGSVMSNMGYSEAASGLSSVTKVLLGYQTGVLAGNLHCTSPRQDVAGLREGRLRVLADHERFRGHYTAVNGISVTGVNAHVLLQGHYKPVDSSRYMSNIPFLVTVSGRHEKAVAKIINHLKSRPIHPEQLALLHNIHETQIAGHMGRGFVILDTNNEQKTISLAEKNDYFDDATRPLWFVYSGMGSQWTGMGVQLMRIPIFAAAIERCRRVLEPKGLDLVHILTTPDKTIYNNILHSFVGIAAVQIGLTDILRELGIKPDKIIGHSVGELGCAYADGCMTAEEMILSAYSRGLVSVQTPLIRGSMAAIGMGYQQISKMCPPEIEVACHNSSESSTISGPADLMAEFVSQLTDQGIFAKEVPCSNIAYHSRYIAEAGPKLLEYLKEVIKAPKPRSDRWVSTSVPQKNWNKPAAKYCSAEYHTNNLLSPVLFEETAALIPSNAVLVEVAPHGLLQAILKRSLPATCTSIALTRRGHPDNAYMVLEAVGNLYMEGYIPMVRALYPKVEFPVSTGTPMLSHLVEWEHSEKWFLPLYVSAFRKTSATCKFVISVFDEEHSYLQGHVIRGKTLYPFAAALIAAWDTLAMSIKVPKKKLSVTFHDVHLYAQPVLHDRRQLRLSVALHRGSGRFEIMDEDFKVATGFIYQTTEQKTVLKTKYDESNASISFNTEDIYQLLHFRDYAYSGQFRSIHSANVDLTEAQLVWRDNWVTLLDGMLQLNALRRQHHAVSQPTHIRSIKINLREHLINTSKTCADGAELIKAHVSEVHDNTRCGGILIENIKFRNLSPMIEEFQLKAVNATPLSSEFDRECSGETYVPHGDSLNVGCRMTLRSSEIGDLNSLEWVQAPEPVTIPGVKVNVHYAGINVSDILKATGTIPSSPEDEICLHGGCYGMDFSGITDSGERVMGLVRGGACSSAVRARPELLWPVPAHWSLQDAATVPLAYAHAYYCLHNPQAAVRVIKSGSQLSILIHGGAGALGQAIISVALAQGYEVFTTVSDINKKRFLLKLFPDLKEENIGNSRDDSFGDMVMSATNSEGCDIVVCCVKGELKNVSLQCTAPSGMLLDTAQLSYQEDFSFGMSYLTKERSYLSSDISSVFKNQNTKELKKLHEMVSEGIAQGYIRPLTRVTYTPQEAPSAFRLLAASQHRGRVLLDLHDSLPPAQSRLDCKSDHCHLILCGQEDLEIQLVEKLVNRGVKKLHLHYQNYTPTYLRYKILCWQKLHVEVEVSSEILHHDMSLRSLLNNVMRMGPIEGIYVVTGGGYSKKDQGSSMLKNLDLLTRKLCPTLKYFGLFGAHGSIDELICLTRAKDGLPATTLSLVTFETLDGEKSSVGLSSACSRGAVEALEVALCSGRPTLVAQRHQPSPLPLLQQLAAIANISVPENLTDSTTIEELGVPNEKLQFICTYLRDTHNIYLMEELIPRLTAQSVHDIEEMITESGYREVRGLETFFSYVDPDELLATTDIVFMPTLTNSATMRDDEFDMSQIHLCIVPGLEGHHERFRALCERLKLPALVLQPGLDNPHETVRDTAQRYAKVLLKKTGLENNFYLLGYEYGVLVALEVAAILEEHGQTGTVFCLGDDPEGVKAFVDEQVKMFATKEQLQNAIIRHMSNLMTRTNDTAMMVDVLENATSWHRKVDACVLNLLGRVSHSAQYARALIECAFARIVEVQRYAVAMTPLRSQLVLLRSSSSRLPHASSVLQKRSQQPIAVHHLAAPLPHAANDMRCAAIVNKYLAPDIIEAFEQKNLCETYLINADAFMTTDEDVQ